MGQQQHLLIILGVLIVGIAIAVGVGMFRTSSTDMIRNAVISDLNYYAGKAREYYWKPRVQGGGDRSFADVRIDNIAYSTENHNGRYFVESSTDMEVVLVGVGKMISGDDSIRVRMIVSERRNLVEILN